MAARSSATRSSASLPTSPGPSTDNPEQHLQGSFFPPPPPAASSSPAATPTPFTIPPQANERSGISVHRLALESIPLPVLIFEPSFRLNFFNTSARFFGSEIDLKSWVESEKFRGGPWGAAGMIMGPQQRKSSALSSESSSSTAEDLQDGVLWCHQKGSERVKCHAVVSSFYDGGAYFSPQPGTAPGDGGAEWFVVTLTEVLSDDEKTPEADGNPASGFSSNEYVPSVASSGLMSESAASQASSFIFPPSRSVMTPASVTTVDTSGSSQSEGSSNSVPSVDAVPLMSSSSMQSARRRTKPSGQHTFGTHGAPSPNIFPHLTALSLPKERKRMSKDSSSSSSNPAGQTPAQALAANTRKSSEPKEMGSHAMSQSRTTGATGGESLTSSPWGSGAMSLPGYSTNMNKPGFSVPPVPAPTPSSNVRRSDPSKSQTMPPQSPPKGSPVQASAPKMPWNKSSTPAALQENAGAPAPSSSSSSAGRHLANRRASMPIAGLDASLAQYSMNPSASSKLQESFQLARSQPIVQPTSAISPTTGPPLALAQHPSRPTPTPAQSNDNATISHAKAQSGPSSSNLPQSPGIQTRSRSSSPAVSTSSGLTGMPLMPQGAYYHPISPAMSHLAREAPDPLTVLKFATLRNIPGCGIILASKDLRGGYVNPKARELLMGIGAEAESRASSSAADGGKGLDSDDARFWWEEGTWIGDDGWEKWEGDGFWSGMPDEQGDEHARGTQSEGRDGQEGQDGSGEKRGRSSERGPPKTPVEIGQPTMGYKTTVSTILNRSLQRPPRKKQRGVDGAIHPGHSSKLSSGGAGSSMGRPSSFQADSSPLASNEYRPADPQEEEEESAFDLRAHYNASSQPNQQTGESSKAFGNAPAKPKPYKVYDATFSQRVLDPLEPLLEMCARRGEEPSIPLGGHGRIVIGIEVELPESAQVDNEAVGFAQVGNSSVVVFSGIPDSFQKMDADFGPGKRHRRRVRRRMVEVTGAPLKSPVDGQHLGGMLILRDVTDELGEERGIESVGTRALMASKKRDPETGQAYFKQILDHMPQMVWTTTPMGSHDYFNNQWYEYTGLEPEQSLGLGWQNPFHEDDMPHTIKAWSHSLATGDPYSTEYRCRRYDGTWRWMLGRALPLRDANGKIQGWFGTCTDVEDFVNVRTKLAEIQEQVSCVISGADVTLISVDRDLKITFFEGHGASQLQFRRGDRKSGLVGEDFREVFPDSTLVPPMEKIIAGEAASAKLEVPEYDKDGKSVAWFRCSASPPPRHLTALKDQSADSKGIVGAIVVATDITDVKEVEIALKNSFEERSRLLASETAAKEASRLKSEFVSNISHEVRTPAAAVIGMAELLLDDNLLHPELRDSVSKILRSGEILLDMVGMVLDMGKVEAGKLELEKRPFRLAEIVSDARMFSISAQKKGIRFEEEVEALYEGLVLGDMPRLRQVLSNLLSNAIKFTKRGFVALRAKVVEETKDLVKVKFVVQDTGVGIREETIPQLFKPFQQADASTARKFGGTGLGLCISKNFIELMGGTIDLESTFGKGTKMTVSIPLDKASSKTPDPLSAGPSRGPSPPNAYEPVDRSRIWILVAEDNELNREIVVRTLKKMKFNAKAVKDGREAIQAMSERLWDLVLMDGQMPGVDGYEATRQIRADKDPKIRNVKIIALTAAAIQGDRERFIDAGMDDYLSKPVRAAALEQMILRHLNGTSRSASAPV